MNNNSSNNNIESVKISDTTNKMLDLLRRYSSLQCEIISMFEEEKGGENVIEASAELYISIMNSISQKMCDNLAETQVTEL